MSYQQSVRILNKSLMILLEQLTYSDKGNTVPLRVVAGNQEKILYDYLYNRNRDGDIEIALVLPALSVSLTDVQPDRSKKRQQKHLIELEGIEFTEIPIKLTFDVTVMTQTVNTAMEILEQILLMFDPFYAVDIQYNRDMAPVSTKFYLDSTNLDIQGEYGQNDKRVLTMSLQFTTNGYIFRESTIGSQLITQINLDNLQ
jgi:hypothetical protein